MQIIRAHHLGMCFGVRDAVQAALSETTPMTILGDLVHNPAILAQLREKGVQSAKRIEDIQTRKVMITAHGASQRLLNEVRARGFEVFEGTCPLVHVAHRALAGLVADGFYPVVIGQQQHVEVKGLTGDFDRFTVILDEEHFSLIPEEPRIGIVAQTTQPIARVERLVELLRLARPHAEIRFVDTVCQPTKLRQEAAVALAKAVDLVIVIGGASSNNTRELAETCARFCSKVRHVQNKFELRPEWFADVQKVGITAGTSTPARIVDEVEAQIREFDTPTVAVE